ncbi:DUF2783 domain-containing protein [Benzoatithermus flavus]|uniref:DUF2783 domain-containing protein n=1 Tax=Benzoatithermus flavus TaxID=3108223 RepID=A0ABU8XUH6_9PROT
MTSLITTPNLEDPDGFYAALVAAHQGLPEKASALLNARLVLILANHIGEEKVLEEALALARAPLAAEESPDAQASSASR